MQVIRVQTAVGDSKVVQTSVEDRRAAPIAAPRDNRPKSNGEHRWCLCTVPSARKAAMFARTSIGGLLLEEVDGWTFNAQDGVIAGRFRDDPGTLLITTIASNRLPGPVTHEACFARAAQLAEVTDPTPADWKTLHSVTGPYGSANFERGLDRVYCWYCCRAAGVIVGTYSCPAEVTRTFTNRALRAQCHGMITSAIFDRRIWGADDEITRVLIALLGADDLQDEETALPPESDEDAG